MNDKQVLLDRIDRLHTTEKGVERIRRNLGAEVQDVVKYCRDLILDDSCRVYRRGRNWYCENEKVRVTVNAHTCTIITAHLMV